LSQTNVRTPQLQVLVNGVALTGVYEIEVQSNAYLGADRFSFSAALSASPTSIWTSLPLLVEVQIGFDNSWQSMITGAADCIQIDPIRESVRASGRDMTALFVAAQTRESFENLTSSDVATLLAGRHGLTASVVPTSTLIGRFFQDGHTRSALSQHGRATTEWDVLSWLGQQEGYDVWVAGTTLFFRPPSPGVETIAVEPNTCMTMQLSRDLVIASGFTIEVMSWNSSTQQAVTEQATYGAGTSTTSNMIALRPNLSVSDAQSLAQKTASQLGGHERTLSYEAPGDVITAPRLQLQLSGTNTDFDGTYVIFEVERRFSTRLGFTQHVQARRPSWTIS